MSVGEFRSAGSGPAASAGRTRNPRTLTVLPGSVTNGGAVGAIEIRATASKGWRKAMTSRPPDPSNSAVRMPSISPLGDTVPRCDHSVDARAATPRGRVSRARRCPTMLGRVDGVSVASADGGVDEAAIGRDRRRMDLGPAARQDEPGNQQRQCDRGGHQEPKPRDATGREPDSAVAGHGKRRRRVAPARVRTGDRIQPIVEPVGHGALQPVVSGHGRPPRSPPRSETGAVRPSRGPASGGRAPG